MASTYENAALILSATGSNDVNGGLLRPRISLAKNHQVFNINWANSTRKPYKIYVRKRLHHSSIIPDVTYPDRDCPLLSRAWASRNGCWPCGRCTSCQTSFYGSVAVSFGASALAAAQISNGNLLSYKHRRIVVRYLALCRRT